MRVGTELIIQIANINVPSQGYRPPPRDNDDHEYYIDVAHGTITELAEGRISLRLDVR